MSNEKNKTSDHVWSSDLWQKPEEYVVHLLNNTNYINSFSNVLDVVINHVEPIDNPKIADMGNGFGWSTLMMLNCSPDVEIDGFDPYVKVDLEDSKKITHLLKLNKYKYRSIRGNFESLSSEERREKYDIIVAVASLHHSLDLKNDLLHIGSGLKKDGLFILSNELFLSRWRYDLSFLRKIIRITLQHFFSKYDPNEQKITQGRIQYDSFLGDWFIKKNYLLYLAKAAGLELVEEVYTKMHPYINPKYSSGNLQKLQHLIFKKI